ncbi:MAG: CPBP family glutamic-type intramembrane protease [Pseudomonadota bacterium]
MDRHAALAVLAAIPVLAAVFYYATRLMPPLQGYLFGLGIYWFCVLTPLIIWRGGFGNVRYRLILPQPWLLALNAALILGVCIAAVVGLQTTPLPLFILTAVACAAVINGSLEEIFWRGKLLSDDADRTALSLQLILFVGWHVALLFAGGVVVTGGALGLLGGAAIGGLLWTWARVQTGSVGFNILCHVGLNLFAFTELATNNPI